MADPKDGGLAPARRAAYLARVDQSHAEVRDILERFYCFSYKLAAGVAGCGGDLEDFRRAHEETLAGLGRRMGKVARQGVDDALAGRPSRFPAWMHLGLEVLVEADGGPDDDDRADE